MPVLKTNDGVSIQYRTYGSDSAAPLILLHGFTGSGAVFQRNIDALSKDHHVIVPDLRGHGDSDKPKAGYHVARLAVDLANLLEQLGLKDRKIKAIGTSLGAAILWCYSELFTTDPFSHMVFVDQAPLQNRTADWDLNFCNRGMNNPLALSALQHTLATEPEVAHRGTIAACLGYRFDPIPGEPAAGSTEWIEDEVFFLGEALQGNAEWYGKLMADHTSLDWRDAIAKSFGPESGSGTKVLVVASSRSGCFPAAGPMKVVDLVNGSDKGSDGTSRARGVVVEWGGHWCYWEKPQLFNDLVLEFLT